MFDLTGKVALITGGNSGIGLGMAHALAAAGADVCIWGRSEEKNREAEEELRRHGRRVLALTCDVSDEGRVEECFARTVVTLGKVDSCFANAGVGQRGTPFHTTTAAEWREIVGINLEGAFFTFRSAINHMIDREIRGSLVATSSLASVSGQPRGEHYAATKAGLLAMVRSIAVEYARYGIRANCIIPGWIETGMTKDILDLEIIQKAVLKRIPQRRWGVPEDFGAIAVYFASDASAYHTGDTVTIDGGYIRF
ncbi:MAG: SDR family oxidoreductase [Deltaproteobacteria bacterium]|nr:SDR family oxidoreductase [Deltaproteobacteria bacterium]